MINPQNQRIAKIIELLEQMNLFTSDELVRMEEYLSGEAGEEALGKLKFCDLSLAPGDLTGKMRGVAFDLLNKGRNEEAARLGELLFAVGQSTCYEMMPIQNYYSFDKNNIPLRRPEKKAAVYAARIGMNEYQISRAAISNLIKVAEEDPEALRKAISFQKTQKDNGKLILLTAYFRVKYPNAPLAEEGTGSRQGGILAGVGKLFGKDGKKEAVEIPSQDAALLRLYEDILVNSLHSLYKNQMPRLELDEIVNAVRGDQVDGRIVQMAARNLPLDRFMLRILGGTAFVNYGQSTVLKNVLRICLAANTEMMLDIMDSMDLRGDFAQKDGNQERGGNYDELFGIDSRKFIAWAAKKPKVEIMKCQFRRNRDAYLECMNTADFDVYNGMNAVVRELDPGLYKARMGKELSRQQTKVIDAFVQTVEPQVGNMVRDYLSGQMDFPALSLHEDQLQRTDSYRWGGKHIDLLLSYQSAYGYDDLSNRCETFLMMSGGFSSTRILRKNSNEVQGNQVKRLFATVDKEGLGLRQQLKGYGDAYDSLYLDRWKEELQNAVRDVFTGYLKERREEVVQAFREAASNGRCLGVLVMGQAPQENKEALLGFAQDSSKAVREELLRLLEKTTDWEEDILKMLSSKKAAERELAIRVLAKWDGEKYAGVLTESLAKEKNGKVRSLLETVLHISGSDGKEGGNALTQEDLVKELHKGGKKRSLAWAYETPFSTVHKKDGAEASEEYLQAVFLSYASMSPCGVSPTAATLAQALDEREFALYVNELFDKWMEAGAESKKRWVLYAASIHGGDDIVKKLHHQIQEWPNAARGAIASEAVQALALSPRPQALLIVDGISRKFKFKQVKAAAGKALEFAASQLGITTEELADRIVPDLGFDEKMERVFDYGERKFTVTITTALEIEVYDEKGKKVKSLPAPGKRDDEEKAAAAYEEFKQMKKQMKTTVSSQKMRLEMALSTGRLWSVEAWRRLFVKNPVMHQFAMGLIWGIYEDRKLVSTFRYMEDGTFNTEDEEEFELPENEASGEAEGTVASLVGLVHPIELSEESRKAWKEQLEDYEIAQPIEQLDRPVYYRTKEEEEQKSLERFGGCIVNDLSLGGKLQTLGWYRGSVQDGGGFYSYYREDKELGLGVELHFSGSYVGGENDDVTVYEARFYNAGGTPLAGNGGVLVGNISQGSNVPAGIRRGSYVYDEANDSNSYCLKEIPERYFSEIVLQLAKATAASKEKNVNWKTARR